jgi:hypothetical protein
VFIFIFILLHLFSFKTPILLGKNKKNIKSIVGISPMVLLYYPGKEDIKNEYYCETSYFGTYAEILYYRHCERKKYLS